MVTMTIAARFTVWNLFIKMMLCAVISSSTCLMFKAFVCWFPVSWSGCNWKFFMDQSHLTPKRDQSQLNDLVQHAAGNSCSIHCDSRCFLNQHITATSKRESKSIKNIYKSCTITVIDSQTIINNLRGNQPMWQTCDL